MCLVLKIFEINYGITFYELFRNLFNFSFLKKFYFLSATARIFFQLHQGFLR